MTTITIQIIEGLERGQILEELPTPVSIGREDDNSVRLNDERVSRFHAKIQADGGHVILTDLDSTNGTRVNGHPVQMRVLQYGDQLTIGRCLLIYGSQEQIADAHNKRQRSGNTLSSTHAKDHTIGQTGYLESNFDSQTGLEEDLFPAGPPELPASLPTIQKAQVSEVFAYMHEQIRKMIHESREDRDQKPPSD
ncbi:MAG: FHA domain-containing protein, partial [Planctomycetaceae bacterium]|nr:FHA domain-containing protein [Planctomycetaceae bacterium]